MIDPSPASLASPIIELRHVGKSFGPVTVLDDVSFTVQESEVTCIIGPSGSGKSSLLRSLAGLDHYDRGEIRIEGTVLPYTTDRRGARVPATRNIGMVFQQFNLWPHMTALENVTEALLRVRRLPVAAARTKGLSMLDRVGLAAHSKSHPARLSGGQQQRVAIARALAMEPHIMLFDEPTSALDPELVGEVLQVMQSLASEGMTMIVVTHEMGFAAQVADTVLFLEGGRLRAQGTPRHLFHDDADPRLRRFLQNYLDRNAFWTRDEPA